VLSLGDISDMDGAPDPDWESGLEGGTFIKFSEDPVVVEFMENVPIKRKSQYGKDVWDWEVLLLDEDLHEIGGRVLSTASKRLRRLLKKHAPLTHCILRIKRVGEGMLTEYVCQKMNRSGNDELV
jgi:hypothetical protein